MLPPNPVTMRALKPCPAARAAPHHQARPTGPRPIAQRAPRIHAAAAPAPASDAPGLQASPAAPPAHASSSSSSGTARRDLLLLAVASPALLPLAAQASGNDPVTASSGGEYDTFFGFATPPTSYGGCARARVAAPSASCALLRACPVC